MDDRYRIENADELITPALVYYPDIIAENIDRMVRMAGGPERLCPHVKTYKTAPVVRMLLNKGIRAFKCATIAEAEMTAECGAEKVILAYPLVGVSIKRFLTLCKSYPGTTFFAIGDDESQVRLLSDAAIQEGRRVSFLLDIDTGLHRTGVSPALAAQLYPKLCSLPGIAPQGFHVYDGQHHESEEAVRHAAVLQESKHIFALQAQLTRSGLPCDLIVAGGTPTFPCHITERVLLSPGTCVIQDAGYRAAYRDLQFEIAGLVLTRVISHPGDDLFTLDLGCKAIASDPPIPRSVILDYEDCETLIHNEEHMVLRLPSGEAHRRPAIGTTLYAVPWHTCPTTLLYPEILAVQNHRIIDIWPVTARDRKIRI